MAEKQLNARISCKNDVEANWLKATNFIPKAGEIIVYNIDSNNTAPRMKVGDGATYVNNLPFVKAVLDENTGNLISTFGPIRITTSNWTSSNGGYTYTYTNSGITADMAIVEFLPTSATQGNQLAAIDWETFNGRITFTTATKPAGTLEITLIMCGTSGALQTAAVATVNNIMPDAAGNINTFIYSETEPEAVEGVIWLKPED